MSDARSETIRWYPRCTVEKYSADQVAWARRRAVPVRGANLRALFRRPEDGYAYAEGNGVVLAGLANLALVLTGTGGHPLAPGRAVFGVGTDGDTAFSAGQAHLAHAPGEAAGRSHYQPMDPGFPRVPRPAVIEGQATFAEPDANFTWAEWCWATGFGAPRPGAVLAQVYSQGAVMLNRKAPPGGFGTKEGGVAWVFRTEVSLS